MRPSAVPVTAIRRLAIAAQRYASRGRRGTTAEVEAAVRHLSCVQLDSISTVERSHRIALGCRVGAYPKESVSRLLGRGRLIEYWAHEACLLPADDWPLFRPAMQVGGRRWYGEIDRTHPHLREHVLDEIRARGPLGSRHFDGAARKGEMWGWKPAKRMLELLWNHGELVVAGRQGFQRLYDLPERVLDPSLLNATSPSEPERLRELVLRSVRARGALTESGVVEHWRLRGGTARIRPVVAALVADGVLERRDLDDGGPPVRLRPGDEPEAASPGGSVRLSPFDNLLWDRPFAERVLGFRHLIEVYKPAPERRYGYYVLPLVVGDRVAGRADVKADRKAGVLRLLAWHPESRRRSAARDDALERAFARLARQLALDPAS